MGWEMHIRKTLTVAVAAGCAVVAGIPLSASASTPGASAHVVVSPSTYQYKSLVYVKNGDIYLAHQDGTHPVLVKKGTFYWPSMDDGGGIVAEAADGRDAPDLSPGYSIYRYWQSGALRSHMPSPADFSTLACPTYPPNHVMVSPDGKHVAYDFFDCDQTITVWTPATNMSFPGQGAGQEGYNAPVWLTSSRMLATHIGVRVAGGKEVGTFTTSSGQDSVGSWFDADSWATGFLATTTRDDKKVAILEDDAADYIDGLPRHVKLVLGTTAGLGKPMTVRCRFSLYPSGYGDGWNGVTNASISFRTGGIGVAWDAGAGTWYANTSNLSNCSSVKPHLWIKGAYDAFFSPAIDHR